MDENTVPTYYLAAKKNGVVKFAGKLSELETISLLK